MSEAVGWAILSTRYGGDIRQPSHEQLAQAIDELLAKGMADAEHPNAWLRYGYDEGPVYVIDAYRGGTLICSQFADQDDADPITEHTLTDVPSEQVLSLWKSLARGDVASIRADYPDVGW